MDPIPVSPGAREIGGRRLTSILVGFGLALVLHLFQGIFTAIGGLLSGIGDAANSNALMAAGSIIGLSALVIGLTQLIYIVPAVIIAFLRRYPGVAQGLIIGAIVTFLLNAACYGIFIGGLVFLLGSNR